MKWCIGHGAMGLVLLLMAGCGSGDSGSGSEGGVPSFTLAWSEYPSWSVFGVAHASNLIHKGIFFLDWELHGQFVDLNGGIHC